MMFVISLMPRGWPEPVLFFFNLSTRTMSVRQASGPPGLHRWIIVDAGINPVLYYKYSYRDDRGCQTFLVGSFKTAGDNPLPFKALVAYDLSSKCKFLGLKKIKSFSEAPPNYLAKIAPGDFSLTRLLDLKTPEDYDNYMAEIAPGKFKGFLRTGNMEQFPDDVTKGRKPNCWLDIDTGPSFFSTITFFIMIASALLMAAIRIFNGKSARPTASALDEEREVRKEG